MIAEVPINPTDIVSRACLALESGDKKVAGDIINNEFPHEVKTNAGRKYSEL